MEKLKYLFQQIMMISFGILIGITVEGIFYGKEIAFEWYHPLSILMTGVVCSLPGLFLWGGDELPRRKYMFRIVLHFLVLFALVMGIGKLARWYTMWVGALFIAVEFIFVYIFVWVATTWMGHVDGKHINNALDGIRDEE